MGSGVKKLQQACKEVSIADLIGLVFAPSPVDPADTAQVVSPPAQPQPTQITPATAEEMTKLVELAEETCELSDKIQGLVGSLTVALGEKKKELMTKMLGHGLKKVSVADRPPVELTISNSKNSSKTALIGVLGVAEGSTLWNKLPTRTSESLKIPPKTAPEG